VSALSTCNEIRHCIPSPTHNCTRQGRYPPYLSLKARAVVDTRFSIHCSTAKTET